MTDLTCLEICAGAGGQALGLEQAGFAHAAAVEIDADACETLRRNRGVQWKIIEDDVADVDGHEFRGADLLAGGVPCPPFSVAGRQLGGADERDLFPEAIRLVSEIGPRAVLLENVRGLAARRFDGYRAQVLARLHGLGYTTWWRQVHASEHGVPQLRPRLVLVALRQPWAAQFCWPEPAPRARAAWHRLGVDGLGIADEAPGGSFPVGLPPRLTIRMVARLQGLPDSWEFYGRMTAAYRQVGNAFPAAGRACARRGDRVGPGRRQRGETAMTGRRLDTAGRPDALPLGRELKPGQCAGPQAEDHLGHLPPCQHSGTLGCSIAGG